jgi:hypothetical protein
LGRAVFVSELRTKWFAAYRTAMGEMDSQEQGKSIKRAFDLMRYRARQITAEHGTHVEKHLMMDAMAKLEQRRDRQAA